MSLLFAAMLAAAAPAKADALAVQSMHDFGACVADARPGEARDLMAMDFNGPDYGTHVEKLAMDSSKCLWPGSKLGFSPLLLAGALAEALLARETALANLSARLAPIPTRAPLVARSESETMALCTVIQSPQAAADLLRTRPATAEERQAMAPIVEALPNCLKKDVQMTLNARGLRALLALAAWRIVEDGKAAQ